MPEDVNGRDWVITRSHRGLSNARNLGVDAATGEIVAFIDDDAYPDPQWLKYLAAVFLNPAHPKCAGVGGPNIAPPSDGLIAGCVAHAPGGPIHVLITNRKAEHIPGCNMAFRRTALKAIGGFDPQFHVAGDDVDVCWRLQMEGWTLGFSPAAMVWHHRRNSVRAYLQQQQGYGKAEAMLESKWPDKYNIAGHAIWAGRIYTNGLTYTGWRMRRIYHGMWGTAPFQSLYEPMPNLIESLPMMPEWYFVIFALAGSSLLGLWWHPLRLVLPLLLLALTVTLVQACRCGAGASFQPTPPTRTELWLRRMLTGLLYLLQPLARLVGRVRYGLTFWRRRALYGYSWPRRWIADIWTKEARTVEERLQAIEAALRKHGCMPDRGGDYDRWDLQISGGILGKSRIFVALDNHASGRQLLRVRCWPVWARSAVGLALFLAVLSVMAARDGAWAASVPLAVAAGAIVERMFRELAATTAAFLTVVREIERAEKIPAKDVMNA